MSDPTATVKQDTKTDAQKPTRALPTDRVGFDKQLAVLQAYGAIADEEGQTAGEIGKVVPIHNSSVSVCNPFFAESGLIERSGVGYKASSDVVKYHQAMQWDAATAGEKLAPTMRGAWYWKDLFPRLSFRPMEEAEAIRVLAESSNAGPAFRGQIRTILDYLAAAGLIVREGNLIKKGPQATMDLASSGGKTNHDSVVIPKPIDHTPPPPPPPVVGKLIGFDVSIQLNERDIAAWTPEQINEFFRGLALVISAKKQMTD